MEQAPMEIHPVMGWELANEILSAAAEALAQNDEELDTLKKASVGCCDEQALSLDGKVVLEQTAKNLSPLSDLFLSPFVLNHLSLYHC